MASRETAHRRGHRSAEKNERPDMTPPPPRTLSTAEPTFPCDADAGSDAPPALLEQRRNPRFAHAAHSQTFGAANRTSLVPPVAGVPYAPVAADARSNAASMAMFPVHRQVDGTTDTWDRSANPYRRDATDLPTNDSTGFPTPPESGSRPRPTVTLYPIQEWVGYVTEIRKKSFVARVLDRTAGARLPRETAWIPLTEVSRRDAGRMRPGSVFYRVIGYRRDTSGTKQRVSVIVFRDLSVMTAAKPRSARRWARRIRRAFAE